MKKAIPLLIAFAMLCLTSCAASLKELPSAEERSYSYDLPADYSFNADAKLGRTCFFGSDKIDYFLVESHTDPVGNQVPDETRIYAVKDDVKSLVKSYSKENGDGFDSDIIDFKANARGLYWTTHAGRAFVNFYDAKTGTISEIAAGYAADGFGCDNLAVSDEYLLYTHGDMYYCQNLDTGKIVTVPYVAERGSSPATDLFGASFPVQEKRGDKHFVSLYSCQTGKRIREYDITGLGVENITGIVANEQYAAIVSRYFDDSQASEKSKIFLIDLKDSTFRLVCEKRNYPRILSFSDDGFIFADRQAAQGYIFSAKENAYCEIG